MPRIKVAFGSSKGCTIEPGTAFSHGPSTKALHSRRGKAAHGVLLLAGDGTRSGKHEAEDGVISLFLLDQTLERVDVEGDGVAVNRQDDGRATSVDDDLFQSQAKGWRSASGCGQKDEE